MRSGDGLLGRERRELARLGADAAVVREVGHARVSDLLLPAAQELLQDGLLDSNLVKVGPDGLDDFGDDAPIDVRL